LRADAAQHIKRRCGVSCPRYRYRVRDDVCMFYDVAGEAVQVLAIGK
jgi:hypothetical protein